MIVSGEEILHGAPGEQTKGRTRDTPLGYPVSFGPVETEGRGQWDREGLGDPETLLDDQSGGSRWGLVLWYFSKVVDDSQTVTEQFSRTLPSLLLPPTIYYNY